MLVFLNQLRVVKRLCCLWNFVWAVVGSFFLSCSVVLWRWCCQIAVKFSNFCSFDWPGTMFICYLLLSWMLELGWFVVVWAVHHFCFDDACHSSWWINVIFFSSFELNSHIFSSISLRSILVGFFIWGGGFYLWVVMIYEKYLFAFVGIICSFGFS